MLSERVLLVILYQIKFLNAVCSYAPQAGLNESEQKNFWDSMGGLIQLDYLMKTIE